MTGETCVVNIGPAGIRRRMIGGVIGIAIGVALVVAMILLGEPRTWRAFAFAPFWLGTLGVFQAREKTCVAFAARGLRDLDAGAGLVPVTDEAERAALSAQARAVRLRATATAVALTAAAFLVP